MKVECLTNRASVLPKNLRTEEALYSENYLFPMEIGEVYTVYAMILSEGYVWYGLCANRFNHPLEWMPGILFKVVESKLSKYWVFSYTKEMNYRKIKAIWAYPEWVKDLDYYEKLQKWDQNVLTAFNDFKLKIDNENNCY